MSDRGIGESAEDILSIAHAHGCTATQVARWRRRGLLPAATQYPMGRGRGTRTVYPPGTKQRVRLLCQMRSQERRISYLAWHLWWNGYDVPRAYVRAILRKTIEEWDAVLRAMVKRETGELSEAAWDYMDIAATIRLPHKTLRQARKQIGSARMSTFVRIILQVGTGTFAGYADADDAIILETGLGLRRARIDRAGDAAPWLSGDTGEDLQDLSRLLRDHPFIEVLEGMTDADLARTRDEVSCLIAALGSLTPILERMLGRGAFGLHALGTQAAEMGVRDQALLLLFLAAVRAAGQGENIDILLELARTWLDSGLDKARAWECLPIEVPAVAPVLIPQQLRAALRDPHMMTRLCAAISQIRASHGAELDAFFQRHPVLDSPPT